MNEVQTPVETQCRVITGTVRDARRCLEPDLNHQGPHWKIAEDLPAGCACVFICTCPESEKP